MPYNKKKFYHFDMSHNKAFYSMPSYVFVHSINLDNN